MGSGNQAPYLVEKHEQLQEKAKGYTLLSDAFVSVALRNPLACQHVLRILTGEKDLILKEVRSQYYIAKIISHDAKLDILAEDMSGKIYSIEIQRKNIKDHAKRVRFYTSMIDGEYLMKGTDYTDLPEVSVFYISEKDLWEAGRTVYQVKKNLSNIDKEYPDKLNIEYVNAAVDDGSEIAQLMQYFKTADPEDMSQGDLSRYVHFLKSEEGGQKFMCEISDEIYEMGLNDGLAKGEIKGEEKGEAKGEVKGREKEKRDMSVNLYRLGVEKNLIAQSANVSVEQVQEWIAMA